jgi:L-seryl-tRNA(Ser) seleniumtransferase
VTTRAGPREPGPDPDLERRLRALPSVEQLLTSEPLRSAAAGAPHALALAAARNAVEQARNEIKRGNGMLPSAAIALAAANELERSLRPSLRPVVNATGVVVHTNLGRAPLPAEALRAIERAASYSNLELELERGTRGSRHAHVERLIVELTGAEAGFAVNNNAAAVLLALAALAPEREVVISRGQLIEIGGSFRIPDILGASGARLVEVGTTNRTRRSDYEDAIGPLTAALMRVHSSNFRTVGFTEEVPIEELCAIARERGLRVIDDLGSGVLGEGDAIAGLSDEPSARHSLEAGADIVCFSGDKLLGGPQAGLIAGSSQAVELLRSHPMARALRIDKLSLAALEATLRIHLDPARAVSALPVLRMLSAPESELAARAERLRDSVAPAADGLAEIEITRASGRVGGGALPLLELEGPVVSVRTGALAELQAELRRHDPPVIARQHEHALLLDPRTMSDEEAEVAAAALAAALRAREQR